MPNEHTPSEKNVYKIGTRGSLLAITQCEQVKRQLEKLTGDQFELEIIKTQGDLDTSVPLWQLEGKDFFTKELDHALLSHDVDLVVHSYKDLGSERPQGIHLAAITKRDFSNDILLIRNDVLEQMAKGEFNETFIVGTSSPRRIVNAESSLAKILPTSELLDVKAEMLRGNVNTRIGKLKDKNYHAIILAMAGLERLARDEQAKEKLIPLIKGLNFAILPQRRYPSAASQGALGIECRKNDEPLKEKLALMNDSATIDEVEREREAFQKYGGGCHLAVGINVRKHGDYFIHTQKGRVDDEQINIVKTEGIENQLDKLPEIFSQAPGKNIFLGMPNSNNNDDHHHDKNIVYDELIEKYSISGEHELMNSRRKIFVATAYAHERLPEDVEQSRILSLWAAGNRTWEKLARHGHWFHGSAEGLGHEEIHRLSRNSELIKLFLEKNFNVDHKSYTVLTHQKGDSRLGPVVYAYDRQEKDLTEQYRQKVLSCASFYWTSARQAESFLTHFPEIAERAHFCGMGKTLRGLQKLELSPIPVASPNEYREIVQKLLND